MRKRVIAALVSIGLVTGAAAVPPASSAREGAEASARSQALSRQPDRMNLGDLAEHLRRAGRPLWAPGEVVVEFRPRVSPGRAREVLRRRGLRRVRRFPRTDLEVARIPNGRPVLRVAAELRALPAVRDASPNILRYPDQFIPNDPLFDPDQWGLRNEGQPHRTAQFGDNFAGTSGADIKATQAWETQQGSEDVVVAVIDTGVDIDHPDIAGNLWVNEGEVEDGSDNTGSGCIDDIHGCDFTESPPDGTSLFHDDPTVIGFDHGTHVAGTVAAVTNNDTGVAGVCPNCKIMVLKAARPVPSGSRTVMALDIPTVVAALDYARRMGADVVNASFGGPILWSGIEFRAFSRAQRAGVLSVVAAGNERGDNDRLLILDYTGNGLADALSPSYPASYPLNGIISVAASNSRDEYGFVSNCPRGPARQWECHFTNWGVRSVHLAAPGVDVLSTVPVGTGEHPGIPADYEIFDGTSMAAPHVAGVAGLVKSQNPGWSHRQVKNAIVEGVEPALRGKELKAFPIQPPPKGRFVRRAGRLDAAEAVTEGDGTFWVQPRTRHDINGALRIRFRRRGWVGWPTNTNHVYKRRLRRGQRWRAVLVGLHGQDVDLHLWRRGTRHIWQIEEGCFPFGRGRCLAIRLFAGATPSHREQITFRVPRTGIYFFHVSAFVLERGPYQLRLRRCTRRAPRC